MFCFKPWLPNLRPRVYLPGIPQVCSLSPNLHHSPSHDTFLTAARLCLWPHPDCVLAATTMAWPKLLQASGLPCLNGCPFTHRNVRFCKSGEKGSCALPRAPSPRCRPGPTCLAAATVAPWAAAHNSTRHLHATVTCQNLEIIIVTTVCWCHSAVLKYMWG